MASNESTERNKLSLSDELSVERTRLSNERTLLAYIRCSLYFSIAGLTINSLVKLQLGWLVELIFWGMAIAVFIAGFIRYRRLSRKLKIGAFDQKRWNLLLEED